MKYGAKLLKSLKDSLNQNEETRNERWKRIGNGETDIDDCFVSMRANEMSDEKIETKIAILENKGLYEFDTLLDIKTNEDTGAKVVNGAYGLCWRLSDEYVKKTGCKQFISIAKKESTYAKKGVKRGTIKLPAWVCRKSFGTGLVGALYQSQIHIFRSDFNYWTGKEIA
tara:strand:- start:17894 stop:18400 length:507 start_codon:yes stop_codon:yes gene_type:complete